MNTKICLLPRGPRLAAAWALVGMALAAPWAWHRWAPSATSPEAAQSTTYEVQGAPAIAAFTHLPTFAEAKRSLFRRVYFDHRQTLYCDCRFDANRHVDLNSCGLAQLAGHTRAARIEVEHVFPAAQFGQSRACWRAPVNFPECIKPNGKARSGRECCLRVDPTFVAAHNDLQNLYPEDGYLNGRRSNWNWGMTTGGRTYGTCPMRFDASIRRVQPPPAIRGPIARTMLYMRDTYGFRLSRQDEQLFGAWNNEGPPDAWEIERNRRIRAIQGQGNGYVENYRKL